MLLLVTSIIKLAELLQTCKAILEINLSNVKALHASQMKLSLNKDHLVFR